MQICNVDHDNDDDDGDNNDDDHDDDDDDDDHDDDDDDLGQLFLSWAAAPATPPGHLIDWLIAHISFHYSPIFLPYFSFVTYHDDDDDDGDDDDDNGDDDDDDWLIHCPH